MISLIVIPWRRRLRTSCAGKGPLHVYVRSYANRDRRPSQIANKDASGSIEAWPQHKCQLSPSPWDHRARGQAWVRLGPMATGEGRTLAAVTSPSACRPRRPTGAVPPARARALCSLSSAAAECASIPALLDGRDAVTEEAVKTFSMYIRNIAISDSWKKY